MAYIFFNSCLANPGVPCLMQRMDLILPHFLRAPEQLRYTIYRPLVFGSSLYGL